MWSKPRFRILSWCLVGALTVSSARCGQRSEPQTPASQMSLPGVRDALEERSPRLLALPGVIGAGLGECQGRACIKVLVQKTTPELAESVGSILGEYPFELEETGELRAQD